MTNPSDPPSGRTSPAETGRPCRCSHDEQISNARHLINTVITGFGVLTMALTVFAAGISVGVFMATQWWLNP